MECKGEGNSARTPLGPRKLILLVLGLAFDFGVLFL